MSINRKKARRTRRRERQQYKARGEHQLLVKIEDALTSKSSGALTPSGTTTGRMSSSQPNLQASPRQRIMDQAALYLAQHRKLQDLE